MLTALVTTVFLAQTKAVVTDYFPTQVGSKWIYSESLNKTETKVEDSVEAEVLINGQPATAVHSKIDDKHFETTYYRVTGDKVMLLGFDPKQPLKDPYATFVLAEKGEMKWSNTVWTMVFDELAPVKMACSAKPLYSYSFKGAKVPAIEVRIVSTFDLSPSKKGGSEQVAVYAKGIGLVEMREIGNYGKQKFTRVRRLESYSIGAPPK